MKVKITNSWHETVEINNDWDSLEKCIKNHEGGLEVTAHNLAEQEVEENWEDYYQSYEQAFNSTYKGILEQLKSEVTYEVIEE